MKLLVAKVLVWNGRSFMMINDFKQADNGESLGSVIREYVAAKDLRLVYWVKV